MGKVYELLEMLEKQREQRLPDAPVRIIATETGWMQLVADVEGSMRTVRHAIDGPMEFAGIPVETVPDDAQQDSFRIEFTNDQRQ